MCYDIRAKLEAGLKRARHANDEALIRQIEEKLAPYRQEELFHASGFSHPSLIIYTNLHPFLPSVAVWGLVPSWMKTESDARKLWNQTLNARGETILEKPAFRDAAKHRRCLIYVDGFFEHHHLGKQTYPFYISRNDGEPMCLAGLWSEWKNPTNGEVWVTCTIVTTSANKLMSDIHNNVDDGGSRMPVILEESQADGWLQSADSGLIKPCANDLIHAHTVRPLRGKLSVANNPKADEEFCYPELAMFGF